MNKIPNRKAICDVLLKEAETDKDIVVLCSDSRGSASLAPAIVWQCSRACLKNKNCTKRMFYFPFS